MARISPERNFKIVCEDEEGNPLNMKFIEGVETEEAEEAIREAIENLAYKFQKEYDIVDDMINCRSISPAKGSLLKSGSIYLATKENIESSVSKSRIYESPERLKSQQKVHSRPEGSMLKFTKGVSEAALEKLDKSFITDRSVIKLTDESIVRTQINMLTDGRSSRNVMYDRHRLVRSKLEQIYTNSVIHARNIRLESNKPNNISLE